MDEAITHHQDTVKQHHVVVLDHDHASASQFLREQGLANRMGPYFDSRQEFGADGYWSQRVSTGQVAGNVHYHHFSDATIPADLTVPMPTQQFGNTDLRYWLKQLRDSLKAGEKVDALVFTGHRQSYDRWQVTQFIAQVKQLCPGIKVVLANPNLDWAKHNGPQLAYAEPQLIPSPHKKPEPLFVEAGAAGYTLAPGIDAVAEHMKYEDIGQNIRTMIGAVAPAPEVPAANVTQQERVGVIGEQFVRSSSASR